MLLQVNVRSYSVLVDGVKLFAGDYAQAKQAKEYWFKHGYQAKIIGNQPRQKQNPKFKPSEVTNGKGLPV